VSHINYNIEPVDEKPKKKGPRRGTSYKYDPIIEAFLESRREINDVAVSVRNKEVYLEKT